MEIRPLAAAKKRCKSGRHAALAIVMSALSAPLHEAMARRYRNQMISYDAEQCICIANIPTGAAAYRLRFLRYFMSILISFEAADDVTLCLPSRPIPSEMVPSCGSLSFNIEMAPRRPIIYIMLARSAISPGQSRERCELTRSSNRLRRFIARPWHRP